MFKHDWESGEDAVEFDEEAARGFVGKYVVVGLEYVDQQDRLTNLVQLHGVIEFARRLGRRAQGCAKAKPGPCPRA
jgi:hypothetical protein